MESIKTDTTYNKSGQPQQQKDKPEGNEPKVVGGSFFDDDELLLVMAPAAAGPPAG